MNAAEVPADDLAALRLALRVFGVVFVVGLWPLTVLWPAGWAWHAGEPSQSHYLQMIIGVYATLVDRVTASGRAVALARGVANLGVRPTVEPSKQARPNLEVHLFDVDEDLYGAALRVHLIARLREERRFSGLPELKAQIARDAEAARARLAPLSADPAAEGAFR